MVRIFGLCLATIRVLELFVAALAPAAYKRHRKKLKSKNLDAGSLCNQAHGTPAEMQQCTSSHLISRRGELDCELLVITTIKDDDRYWEKFFDSLPKALSGVECHYALILERPTDSQRLQAQRATVGLPNLSIYEASGSTIYGAWNLAIRNFGGEFVSNLNVDDIRFSGSFRAQLDFLKAHSWAAGIYSGFHEFSDWTAGPELNSMPECINEKFDLRQLLIKGQNPMHASPVWKRELHEKHGFFNELLLSSGDTEFWLRCLIAGEAFVSDDHIRYATLNRVDSVSSPHQMTGRFEWAATLDKYSRAALQRLFRELAARG